MSSAIVPLPPLHPLVSFTQTDRHGAVLYTNHERQQISGLTDEESQDSGWISVIAPEDQEAAAAVWQQAPRSDQQYSRSIESYEPAVRSAGYTTELLLSGLTLIK